MKAADLPLLLASASMVGPNEPEPLDRLRIQKGVFLLEQRGPREWNGLYGFTPYDWGPFSRQLAGDVEEMVKDSLLDKSQSGSRYTSYRTTGTGDLRVAEVIAELSTQEADFIRKTRAYVTTRSFSRLLRDVYAAFPEYAVNSRFSG